MTHENHRCTIPQQLQCDFYGGKGHVKNSCWHAMRNKQQHDKRMPRYWDNTRYVFPKYKNHTTRRTSLKPQPKS